MIMTNNAWVRVTWKAEDDAESNITECSLFYFLRRGSGEYIWWVGLSKVEIIYESDSVDHLGH